METRCVRACCKLRAPTSRRCGCSTSPWTTATRPLRAKKDGAAATAEPMDAEPGRFAILRDPLAVMMGGDQTGQRLERDPRFFDSSREIRSNTNAPGVMIGRARAAALIQQG